MQRQPAVTDRGPDAGHCTDGTAVARVWFDENVQNNSEYPFGGATSYEGTPYPNPASASGAGTGCRASPSVVGEYAQLPSAGLVDRLSSKAPVTLVDYGSRSGLSAAARRCGRGSGSG